jgi:hypothetical protein
MIKSTVVFPGFLINACVIANARETDSVSVNQLVIIANHTGPVISSYRTGKSISFPGPSHDGKWLMFTMSDYGNFSIPFLLPQRDPDFYDNSLRSFNVPELMKGKIKTNGRNMLNTIGSEAKNVTFELKD